MVAQHPQKRHVLRRIDFARLSVYCQSEHISIPAAHQLERLVRLNGLEAPPVASVSTHLRHRAHIPNFRMPFELSGEFGTFREIQSWRLLRLKAEHSEYAPVFKFLKLVFSDAVQHAVCALCQPAQPVD